MTEVISLEERLRQRHIEELKKLVAELDETVHAALVRFASELYARGVTEEEIMKEVGDLLREDALANVFKPA